MKKPTGGRSRQSAHLKTEKAIVRSLLRGPKSHNKHLREQQVQQGRGSSSHQSPQTVDVELGCSGVTLSTHEDHKTFRREEFEGKLRDMGLELERDEDVSADISLFNHFREHLCL